MPTIPRAAFRGCALERELVLTGSRGLSSPRPPLPPSLLPPTSSHTRSLRSSFLFVGPFACLGIPSPFLIILIIRRPHSSSSFPTYPTLRGNQLAEEDHVLPTLVGLAPRRHLPFRPQEPRVCRPYCMQSAQQANSSTTADTLSMKLMSFVPSRTLSNTFGASPTAI